MALLHAACALGDLDSVRRLIEDGADVNGSQDGAVKPIIAAALGGHEEVLAHLLAQGCDPEASDAGGHTAAGIAKQRGDQRILRLLYAFRSARLAGEIAIERSNLEEERQLLLEVEAEFEGDESDANESDAEDGQDDDQEHETSQIHEDMNDDESCADCSVARDGTAVSQRTNSDTQLTCLFEKLQQLHIRLPAVSDGTAASAADLLRVCEDDQLEDLRHLVEGGLLEISSVQRDRRRQREQQPAGFCQICVENPTNSVFAPCGHVVCCYTCASACNRCPICRGKIGQVIRTFFS